LALALSPHFVIALPPAPLTVHHNGRYSLFIPFGTGQLRIKGIQCGMRFTIGWCHFIRHWCVKAAKHTADLNFFSIRFEGYRPPHAATSPTKILGRPTLRARRDRDNWRSRMSFSRSPHTQDGGTIQIRSKKIVKTGEGRVSTAGRFYEHSGAFGRKHGCWGCCCSGDTLPPQQLLVKDKSDVHTCDEIGSSKYFQVLAHHCHC
jgi:hypothetical protein